MGMCKKAGEGGKRRRRRRRRKVEEEWACVRRLAKHLTD